MKLDDQRIVRKHIEHVQPRITTHVEVPQQEQSEVELSDSLEVPCSQFERCSQLDWSDASRTQHT